MLEENWDAVRVFQLCRQTWLAGFGGAFALGFTALELEAACRLAAIDAGRFPQIAAQVRDMGDVAANTLNERKQ
ncbi:MAG TPA: DUF1799 domain-containing protein [Solimonas sp.]